MRYVWAVLASAWCGCVWAQDCSALKGDEYATCNAVQQNNPRFCEDVKVADVRLMCQAKVKPNSYTCEKIKAAGGKVTREAGPVKGGTTVIAFVTDPDGYKVELIQRAEYAQL